MPLPGESGAVAAAASALAPIGPSGVNSEEATVPDDGSLGGGGGRGRGGDGGSGFDDVLGEGGGGGKFDDLMGDFGLSGVDSKDAKAFLLDDAAPSHTDGAGGSERIERFLEFSTPRSKPRALHIRSRWGQRRGQGCGWRRVWEDAFLRGAFCRAHSK